MTHSTALIHVSLHPGVLKNAGVSLEDALWLVRNNDVRARQRALRHARGENILKRVERFVQNSVGSPGIQVLNLA